MTSTTIRDTAARERPADWSDPVYQGYGLLRLGFVVAPILFGLDKFLGWTADWTVYLWPAVPETLGIAAGSFMMAVGVIEIVAGILVAVKPRIGGAVVALWLAGIIVNVLLLGDHYDVALRDLGLLIGAVTLSRLATAYESGGPA